MNFYAFEFQRDGEQFGRIIPNDGVVSECQAFNLAKVNRETLIGLAVGGSGIHRQILYRPDEGT